MRRVSSYELASRNKARINRRFVVHIVIGAKKGGSHRGHREHGEKILVTALGTPWERQTLVWHVFWER